MSDEGAKTLENIVRYGNKIGLKYITVYAFSTENWNRPKDEVDALMTLLRNYMKTCLKTAEKNRMCVRVLGDKTGLDEDIRNRIEELEKATENNDGLHFQIALNYGGRDEIVRATKLLAMKVKNGEVDYHFIEVMACPGGCIMGGGQPRKILKERNGIDVKNLRKNALYSEDKMITGNFKNLYGNEALTSNGNIYNISTTPNSHSLSPVQNSVFLCMKFVRLQYLFYFQNSLTYFLT